MKTRILFLVGIIAMVVLAGCGTTYSGGSSGGHSHFTQKK